MNGRRWLGDRPKSPTHGVTRPDLSESTMRAWPLIRRVRSYVQTLRPFRENLRSLYISSAATRDGQSPSNGNGPTCLNPAYAAWCPYHGRGMTRQEEYGRSWLSHLTEGEMWCNRRQSFRHCMQSGLVEVTA